MVDIRLPNINATSTTEQLTQLKSYVYQLAEQLNWALNTIENKADGKIVVNGVSYAGNSTEISEDTFDELKDMIIKSADIVTAYYEKIDNLISLNGHYVASSTFGDYSRDTNNRLDATESSITNVISSTEDLNGFKRDTESTLEITEDGLKIGKKITVGGVETFNAFATFSPTKLSFYDSTGSEVAYISNQSLYITKAEITDTLNIGNKYTIKPINGLAFIYRG